MAIVTVSNQTPTVITITTPGPQGPQGPAGSGSIDTGSFATTGSNIFEGSQTVNGDISITNAVDSQMFMHPQIITSNIAIPNNYNAFLISPVSITGTVTVGSGSNLSIL